MHKVVQKPWGTETWLTSTAYYIMRHLFVKKGEAVSLQYHKEKVETLYIIKGSAEYTLQRAGEKDAKIRIVKAGDVLEHRPYDIHRQRALEDFEFIEVSTPQIDDIVRLEDDYGRETEGTM